jgi:hypothetical protein
MYKLILLSLFFTFCACNSKKETAKENFFSKKNINACANVLVDSLDISFEIAQEKCKCMMETAVAIDSSIIKMNEKQCSFFFYEHQNEIISNCSIDELKQRSDK